MAIGSQNVVLITMPSAIASSSGGDMQRTYSRMYVQIPTMTSSSAFDLYASLDGSSYYQIRKLPPGTTATVTNHSFIVAATAAANGSLAEIPSGFRYYKIVATDSAPTAATTFKLYGADA